MMRRLMLAGLVMMAMALAGCASRPAGPDLSAFRAAKPASILVLPPLNESPEVIAPMGFLAQATLPLAESGYYVMPVAVMMETFRQNGLANPPEIHDVSVAKLRQIFGADAALYIKITRYGAEYTLLNSSVVVTAHARLVDLRTGHALWTGSASASNQEGNNNNSGNLIGALVGAVVKQIINSTTDAAYPVAGVTANRLLRAGRSGGMLYGPRSPFYGHESPSR